MLLAIFILHHTHLLEFASLACKRSLPEQGPCCTMYRKELPEQGNRLDTIIYESTLHLPHVGNISGQRYSTYNVILYRALLPGPRQSQSQSPYPNYCGRLGRLSFTPGCDHLLLTLGLQPRLQTLTNWG